MPDWSWRDMLLLELVDRTLRPFVECQSDSNRILSGPGSLDCVRLRKVHRGGTDVDAVLYRLLVGVLVRLSDAVADLDLEAAGDWRSKLNLRSLGSRPRRPAITQLAFGLGRRPVEVRTGL